LATYQYNAVLPRLVNRSYVTEFGGGSGDTVTIRKQAKLTTNKFVRATGIVVQDVTEGSVQLQVGDIYDASVVITQEQWDLDLESFSYQIAEPMGKAMVRTSEEVIYAAFPAATEVPAASDAVDAAADLRALLTAEEVPQDNRVLVIGSNVTTALIKNDHLINANQAGSNETLRNARIGRLFGMDVYESVVVDPDEMFAMHRDAVTFVSITPQLPRGAANAAVEVFDQQAFRVVFDYDVAKKQDTVSGDAYLTAKEIRPEAINGVAFTG
jgi:hypothetical protein